MATEKNPKLAIDGGARVRDTPMPFRGAMGPDERAMIDTVFEYYDQTGMDPGYQGHFEEMYCSDFAASMGGGHADAVATGTAALFIALAALELPQGSEVIVSPITDPGTLSSIIMNGLVPCVADSAPGSYNAGPEQIFSRVTPHTRAIVIVHAAGRAADIGVIIDEAKVRDIKVVEDCAQAHGATWKGQPVGTFGDIAAFSTMYRKAHITGASGGVVFSKDKKLFHSALAHADRGKPRWRDDFDDRDPSNYLFPALNFHTDEISCGIGIASLKRLEETRKRRLAYIAGLNVLNEQSRSCRPSEWSDQDSPFFYPVWFDNTALQTDKITFAKALRAEGIDLNPHYMYLVVDWPWLKPYLSDDADTPNARLVRDTSFNLYLNERYEQKEIVDTVNAIIKVERAYAT